MIIRCDGRDFCECNLPDGRITSYKARDCRDQEAANDACEDDP
jgi:hypothetical protein